MSAAPPLGFKVGARKIDVEEYLPDVGDWEDTVVLHEFEDGWKIVEDETTYDRKLMAKLTKTCVGGQTYLDMAFPAKDPDVWWAEKEQRFKVITEDQGRARKRFAEIKSGKSQEYRAPNHFGIKGIYMSDFELFEDWLEAKWQRQKAEMNQIGGAPLPVYRYLHVEDPEGRPRACVFVALMDAVERKGKYARINNAAYLKSNDLGQKPPIELPPDGNKWRILEVRLGTGNAAPVEPLQYVIEWYQLLTGTWDQEAFEKHEAARYTGVTIREDISIYRKGTKTCATTTKTKATTQRGATA
jgi:hypothetical protein